MKLLGNILWLLFGGLLISITWFIMGLAWCVTIIGIPIGYQCFKFAELSLEPFGKKVECDTHLGSEIVNIIWILVSGWEIALEHFLIGILLCVTIIGIPFGKQFFKLGVLALFPVGAKIENVEK